MKVSKRYRDLYNKIFDGTAVKAENFAVTFLNRRQVKHFVKGTPKLTRDQKKATKSYWKPYCKVNLNWFRYFTFMTGKFDPRYIPEELIQTKIDQHFNSRKLAYGYNDKNNYSLIFNKFKQPKTIVRKIDSLLFDEEYNLLTLERALELILKNDEVIVKPSQDTGGGKNIRFYNTKTDIDELKNLVKGKEENFIIQEIIKQHPEMAKMHPESLNTVRVNTLLLEDGVHILECVMRMGSGNSRVDNVAKKTGIIAGVNQDGTLTSTALNSWDFYSGKRTDKHPQGMPLSDIKVPNFARMIEMAKKVALCAPHFRFLALDFCVDENGDIILIEANMRKIDTFPAQILDGPFFGDLTEKVLDEVFGRKNK